MRDKAFRGPGRRSFASRLQRSKTLGVLQEEAREPEIRPLSFQPFGRHEHVEKLLDVSPNTVDRLIRDEGLPVIRLGGVVRFDLEAVRAWALQRQLQQATQKAEDGTRTGDASREMAAV